MDGIKLDNVRFPHAQETMWHVKNVHVENCVFDEANYIFKDSENVFMDHVTINGNYSFQYSKNIEIHNSVLNSKDAFWETENVTVYDSVLDGEYLGWHSRNLKLVRCHIGGEQPLCYVDGLTLEDCTCDAASDRCFEDSVLEASVKGDITEIKNPRSGHIRVSGKVGKITIDENILEPADCIIDQEA
jgi:hypothetical protein